MKGVISCSVSLEDLHFLKEKKISPTNLMKKAVELVRQGWVIDNSVYENEIMRLKRVINTYLKDKEANLNG